MSILETILKVKREETAQAKVRVTLHELHEKPLFHRVPYSLRDAILKKKMAVIAEVKKASPSKGILRENFDPIHIGLSYARAGASAISVLTDERFFQGSLRFLSQLRPLVTLPLLRKDFVIDAYQLAEAKAAGADAVLLIVAALGRTGTEEMLAAAREIHLECLVEVHSESEAESLDGLDCPLVGINNRDLSTFHTDIETTSRIRPMLPRGTTVISESGIVSAHDLLKLQGYGANGALIGETFMKAEEPGTALAELLMHYERMS